MKVFLSVIFILVASAVSQVTSANNKCSDLFVDDSPSQFETWSKSLMKSLLEVEPARFTKGKYADAEIDQSRARPIQRIPELETETHYFVKHFYHQGKFWIARIPKLSMRDMMVHIVRFKSGFPGKNLVHAQLRFITDEPVILSRLKNGEIVQTEIRDFIFTIEAARPRGHPYSGLDAVNGNYGIVGRLVSTFDRAYVEEILDNDQITQRRLTNVANAEINKILSDAIDWSTQKLFTLRYDSTEANCVNLLFDIIDDSLQINGPRLLTPTWKVVFSGGNSVENWALQALENRGLLGPNSELPDYQRVHRKSSQEKKSAQ